MSNSGRMIGLTLVVLLGLAVSVFVGTADAADAIATGSARIADSRTRIPAAPSAMTSFGIWGASALIALVVALFVIRRTATTRRAALRARGATA